MARTPLTVHLIRTADVNALPRLDAVENKPLERWFSQATAGEMVLRIRQHQVLRNGVCTAADLHEILRDVIPPPTHQPVDDIGLVFCRRWVTPSISLQGLMFDYYGHDPLLGPFTTSNGVPREGCAVFLDAFDPGDEYQQVFTAIHELGHVFNLIHDSAHNSFMTNRLNARTTGFTGEDCDRLTKAAEGDWEYAPGGKNFREGESPKRWSDRVRSGSRSRTCGLKVHLGKDHYLLGEPIILDLEFRALRGESIRVPPELDPGYDNLRVWIENPLGERLLHRPNLYYCRRRAGTVTVTPTQPIRNNPRITFGRSGLNFDRSGVYRVWAEFRLPKGRSGQIIHSKTVELEVVDPRDEDEAAMTSMFCRSSVALFLNNKGGVLSRHEHRALVKLIMRNPQHNALQYARYALACSCLRRKRRSQAKELLSGIRLPAGSLRRGLVRALTHLG